MSLKCNFASQSLMFRALWGTKSHPNNFTKVRNTEKRLIINIPVYCKIKFDLKYLCNEGRKSEAMPVVSLCWNTKRAKMCEREALIKEGKVALPLNNKVTINLELYVSESPDGAVVWLDSHQEWLSTIRWRLEILQKAQN